MQWACLPGVAKDKLRRRRCLIKERWGTQGGRSVDRTAAQHVCDEWGFVGWKLCCVCSIVPEASKLEVRGVLWGALEGGDGPLEDGEVVPLVGVLVCWCAALRGGAGAPKSLCLSWEIDQKGNLSVPRTLLCEQPCALRAYVQRMLTDSLMV